MRFLKYAPGARRGRFVPASAATPVALMSAGLLVALASGAQAAATAVPLGTADDFAVLAGAGITNTGPTTINGDIGTHPTRTISGTGTMTLNGTNQGGERVTQDAKTDLVTAYNVAAGQGPTSPIAADLGGQTLTAGVYNSASSIGLTGALTLDGGGDPNAVFVFQAGSTLTTASASVVNLINGAQSCNVFWQVGSSATLGTGSSFHGTILALTDITVTTGVTVVGRVLARNGAVTLDTDTITRPTCAAATTSPSPSPSTSTSPAPSASPSPSTSTTSTTSSSPTTPGGTATSGNTSTAPSTTTSRQVSRVPSGSVHAGDGSTSDRNGGGRQLPAGAVVLAAVAGMVFAAARRQRRRT